MGTERGYALITGASSGIGREMTFELAKRGYSILAVSNQLEQLESLRKEVENAFSIKISCFELDLAQPEAATSIFRFCVDNEIDVEILINNAGMLVTGDAVHIPKEKLTQILHLHMSTPAMMCRLFGEQMRERGRGYILNVSSISAVMPYPVISLYGPSKAFLRAFSRALRTELKPFGVSVTCLLPGATATALYDAEKLNLSLAKKLGIMKDADSVARAGIKAMFRRRAERVPGLLNAFIIIFIPIVPHVFISWINRYRLRRNKT